MNIIEWMLENKIAENGFAANHIYKGLKLNSLERAEQEALCLLYRKWRPKTETKESKRLPTYQAYELAIAGIDPDDVEPRQVEMELRDE